MRIDLEEYCTYTRYTTHDIDPEDFAEWLEGKKPTKGLLANYIYETWDPIEEDEDNYDTEDHYLPEQEEIKELFLEVSNINTSPKPTIF